MMGNPGWPCNLSLVEKQPEEVIFDQLHTTAFQYTPLGRTILGPAQNIEKMTRAHIQDYISTHYGAHRMVISAAGAVKHEDVVEQVKKHFTKLPSNPITTSQLVAEEPAIFTGSEIRIIDDDLPLAQFAVAFSGASWTDPDFIALMVMQQMLGSWNKSSGGGKHMGSELVQRVAINELAESVMAFNTNYKDTGLFGVYAEAQPWWTELSRSVAGGRWQVSREISRELMVRLPSGREKDFSFFPCIEIDAGMQQDSTEATLTMPDCLSDLAYVIMNGICKLSYRVSEADVIRASNQLKSSLVLHIDGSGPTAEDIGTQLIAYGRRIPYAELFARIDSVDAGTIKRVANRFIFDRDIAISARGPIQDLPDYNWFRRRTYWLRY
ncbi:putative mitochondrial-processing peptidase subunit beta [Capsicum chinense]|nr:putative mitochondrial-processing peptidase subunit beta [Capsicum chinense]